MHARLVRIRGEDGGCESYLQAITTRGLWSLDMTGFVGTGLTVVILIIGYLGVAVCGKRHDLPSAQQQASFHCLAPPLEEEWHFGKSSLASTNQVT